MPIFFKSTPSKRKPHAVMDLKSRRLKANKIERILRLHESKAKIKILEVGTGSGGIAHYFGTHPEIRCEVISVDVVDNRPVKDGYRFVKVGGVSLPFKNSIFDVIITNHVIEHVGVDSAQHEHLMELHRVLSQDGIGYLAVPNRWMLKEPHYRLPFLSWLPRRFRSSFLYLFRGEEFYDCEPLEMRRLEQLLDRAGWKYSNVCIEASDIMWEIEVSRFGLRFYRSLPKVIKRMLLPLMPTLIYRIRK
jgi:SAM-dependent methyltransferase